MRRWLYTAGGTLALLAGPAAAQDRSVKYDLEHVFRDSWFIVSAPTHATASEWRTAGVAAGTFGVLLLVDEPVQEWLRAHPGSLIHRVLGLVGEDSPLNLAGRTRQFLIPLSTVLYTAGWAADSDGLKDAGLGCLGSNLTTTVSRSAVSLLIGRLRPRNDGGAFRWELLGGVGSWDMRSFPGGHAANALSCASYFNHRFDLGIAGPAIYALAGGISLARTVDEAHWTSDTFAGMTYGYAVGRGVASRYRERSVERQAEQSMQPRLSLGWRITFE
ncbi:MAG TPA: phosphatase PAP2 family protein [Longimicrobiales bacterium]|nr:phosphatase PAP2 family protein [Longimicrobiales bacterium]